MIVSTSQLLLPAAINMRRRRGGRGEDRGGGGEGRRGGEKRDERRARDNERFVTCMVSNRFRLANRLCS